MRTAGSDSELSEGRAGAQAMERIRETVSPTDDAMLRYAHMPDSLCLMRRRRRADRLALLLRSALMLLAVAGVPGGVYSWDHPAALASNLALSPHGATRTLKALGPAAPAGRIAVRTPVAANVDLVSDGAVPTPTAVPTAPEPVSRALHRPLRDVAPTPPALPSPQVLLRTQTPITPAPVRPTPTAVPLLNSAALVQSLQALTAGEQGNYGIALIDLTSGQEIDLDAAKPMAAASVNKLEILAALYRQAEQGRLSLAQSLRTSDDDIQDYGTGVIRYQPAGASYTLNELAKLLIEQSDNTASYMLANLVGLATIEGDVQGWGLASTRVGDGISSPHDAAVLLALLYGGRLVNQDDARQMVDYLSHTAWNDRIPAGVPAGVTVAHKIGNQVNVVNDVGIVYLPGRPYILSIFSADVSAPRGVAVEQQISRTVYAFERQLSGAE